MCRMHSQDNPSASRSSGLNSNGPALDPDQSVVSPNSPLRAIPPATPRYLRRPPGRIGPNDYLPRNPVQVARTLRWAFIETQKRPGALAGPSALDDGPSPAARRPPEEGRHCSRINPTLRDTQAGSRFFPQPAQTGQLLYWNAFSSGFVASLAMLAYMPPTLVI